MFMNHAATNMQKEYMMALMDGPLNEQAGQ